MSDSLITRITRRIFSAEISRQVHALLGESENSFTVGARSLNQSRRDRMQADRGEVLEDCLEAWRLNPLARRLVELTSQYVVGSGITFDCRHAATASFINQFWNHRLNHLTVRTLEMCDELSRSGNLFILLSTDGGGMSYVRIIPAAEIDQIRARENDIEQPVGFISKMDLAGQVTTWQAYDEENDAPDADGHFAPVMLHYAVNRPAGAQWGEPDLAPLLRWLSRYAGWLEDRARLNRFRNAFLYVVKARFNSEAERAARQNRLAANPPTPGSILVVDQSESWEVINPRLESPDANADGLALKKMIASGAGVSLHFLAEPESATRTTAEAAEGPTYRRFEQRQLFFLWVIGDLLRAAIQRRALVDRHISKSADITLHGADISGRDNLSFSMASINVMQTFAQLRDRGLIDDSELLRLVYRFSGELVDEEEMLERGEGAGEAGGEKAVRSRPQGKVDLDTGEERSG